MSGSSQPRECSLTYKGRKLVDAERGMVGVEGDDIRFTQAQVVAALGVRSTLLVQLDDSDPEMDRKVPTTEIQELLSAADTIRARGNILHLLVEM